VNDSWLLELSIELLAENIRLLSLKFKELQLMPGMHDLQHRLDRSPEIQECMHKIDQLTRELSS